MGVNIDLGGVGQRRTEADPFAGASEASRPARPEKFVTHQREKEAKSNDPFQNVSLTGEQAKGEYTTPGPINISDPPAGGATTDDQPIATLDDLKKASNAYTQALHKAWNDEPRIKELSIKAFGSNPKDNHTKAEEKFRKLVRKVTHDFDQSAEGKKLNADWLKAYDDVYKAGGKVADDLVPSTSDEVENKKLALQQAERALKEERDIYDAWKKNAVAENDGVKKLNDDINKLKKKVHFSDQEAQADRDKIKKLEGDLETARKQIEKDFTASKGATDQMKQVQNAEKELEKAKDAYRPYEQLEKAPAKAASNP